MELERDPAAITAMTTPQLIRWRADAAAQMEDNPGDTGLTDLYRLSTEEKGNRVRKADQAQAPAARRPPPKQPSAPWESKPHPFPELRSWAAWP